MVTPSNMQGWAFAEEGPTGSGSLVNGPATPPLGTGSARLTVDSTGRYILATLARAGTRLDAITTLGYSTYRTAGDSALAIALQMDFDSDVTDASTVFQGRLVFEPYFTAAISTGVWQTWNPLNNAAGGNWWFSINANNPQGQVACPQSNPCTWTEVLTAFPNAGIRQSNGALLFRAGGPWTGGFDGNVDAFAIGISGDTTTYNFELSSPVVSGTILVDDNLVQCPTAAFTSIQAAVTAAAPGAEIRVCPGTYTEQVAVPAGKNNLTIRSTLSRQAIIKAPPAMTAGGAIVRVTASTGVSIRDFTITGPVPIGACSSFYGVFVDGGGSATIQGNLITEVRCADANQRGIQSGIAILVGRGSLSQVGTATITGNQIEKYQKGGIVVDNTGSSATITANIVRGEGPITYTAQNGIQISRGARGQVTGNNVSDHVYTPATFSASGIILFQPANNLTLTGNNVTRGDVNLQVLSTDQATVSANSLTNSPSFDGIYVDSASGGNQFRLNNVTGNTEFDCLDESTGSGTSGTANTWFLNNGRTDSPAGICRVATFGFGPSATGTQNALGARAARPQPQPFDGR